MQTSQDNLEALRSICKCLVKVSDEGPKLSILESCLGSWETIFYIDIFCSRPDRRAGVYSLAPASSPATPPAACRVQSSVQVQGFQGPK